MVAIIELSRTESQNPEVPDWLREDYFRAIQELVEMGTKVVLSAEESRSQTSHPQRHSDCNRSSDAREVPRGVFRRRVAKNAAMKSVNAF
jgi:hypothetical protein